MDLDKKLELAHDWAMERLKDPNYVVTMDTFAIAAWQYADAMAAEYEKRNVKETPCALKDFLKDEFQPDWSQAPDGYNWWAIDEGLKEAFWFNLDNGPHIRYKGIYKGVIWDYDDEGGDHEKAPTFNYQGDWKDSLRKRP